MSRPAGYGGRGTVNRASVGTRSTAAPKYPHPFFDQGQAYLPTSAKNLFHWCRYYFLTHPAVNAAITKMAEYPVTPILFKTENEHVRKRYEKISRIIDIKRFRVEVGLDYFTYGNAFISVMFPLRKFLHCSECKTPHDIKSKQTKYKWVNEKYHLTCNNCGASGFAKVRDQYIKSVEGIRLVRWSPEKIDIRYNEITGETTYYYTIPQKMQNDIRMGKRGVVDSLPDVFIKSVQKSKKMVLSQENLFHFRRPSVSQASMGWGTPLVMPVLKDLHYLGVLRRSQEAIAQEHIVPLRVIFPQAGAATSDPYSMLNLSEWKTEVQKQVSQWKIDPNRIPIMPLPLGYQTIGGNGRALVLHNEYRVWSEHIVAGMGVPPEFVFGGIQYSGTNLTMFQLHNKFLSYIDDQKDLVFGFIFKKIASFMGYPDVDGDFRAFKMADDLQRTMLYFQLVQGQKLSDRTLLEDLGFDPAVERKKMDAERGEMLELQRRMQVQQAHMQGDVMQINTRYQGESQLSQVKAQMQAQKEQMKLQQEMQQEQQAEAQQAQQAQLSQSVQSGGALPQGAQTGNSVAPGFPEGATAYARNGQRAPQTGVPPWFGTERTGAKNGAQLDISYVAKRAAAYVRGLPPDRQQQVLQSMSTANPSLYQMVQNMLASRTGDQSNPLNPQQNPMAQMKPSRATAARKVGY